MGKTCCGMDSINVKFVLPSGKTPENVSDNLKLAFQSFDDSDVEVIWIDHVECLRMEQNPGSVFVCEPFEGQAFDHLIKLNCRVVGPLCVRQCVNRRNSIRFPEYPVATAAMIGLNVGFTSLDYDTREKLSKRAKRMGAQCYRDFRTTCSHLVAGQIGSKKYRLAADRNIPVMEPEWILKVFKASMQAEVHATDPEFASLTLPLFTGVNATVSQISAVERKKIMNLITRNGGNYSGEMKVTEITHLILDEATGPKYKTAMKFKISVVTPKWVYDSVDKGYAQDVDDYTLATNSRFTSTPTRSSRHHQLPDSDITGIQDSILPTTLSETMMVSPLEADISSVTTPVVLSRLQKCASTVKNANFLNGCTVYFNEFGDDEMKIINRISNSTNINGCKELTKDVTHIVVKNSGGFVFKQLEELQLRPFVVTLDWLLESCETGRRCSEAKHEIERPIPIMGGISPLRPERDSEPEELPEDDVSTDPFEDGMDGVMLQYVDPGEGKDTPQTDTGSVMPQNRSLDEPLSPPESALVPTGRRGMFGGMTFAVPAILFADHKIKTINEMVENNGGVVVTVNSKNRIDYTVVPFFLPQNLPDDWVNVVTDYWLTESINEGRALDRDPDSWLYRGWEIIRVGRPLEGCVVCLSNYNILQKGVLKELGEALGARIQDVFTKSDKPSKGWFASTHLVTPTPVGPKYDGAVKWNLPVVTQHWLISCGVAGKRLPETGFLTMNSTAQSNGQNANTTQQRADIPIDASTINQTSSTTLTTTPQVPQRALNRPLFDPDTPNVGNGDLSGIFPRETTPANLRSPAKTIVQRAMNSPLRRNVLSPLKGDAPSRLIDRGLSPRRGDGLSPLKGNIPTVVVTREESDADKSATEAGIRVMAAPQSLSILKGSVTKSASGLLRAGSAAKGALGTSNRQFNFFDVGDTPGSVRKQMVDPRRSSQFWGDRLGNRLNDASQNLRNSQKPKPLMGCAVVVCKDITPALQAECSRIGSTLGAVMKFTFDKHCTHLIVPDKVYSAGNKDMLAATKFGRFIVTPEWLLACDQGKTHVEEDEFTVTKLPPLTVTKEKHTQSFNVSQISQGRTPLANAPSTSSSKQNTPMCNASREMEELLRVSTDHKKRLDEDNDDSQKFAPVTKAVNENTVTDSLESQMSAGITWLDPVHPLQKQSEDLELLEEEKPAEEMVEYRIMLSSLVSTERTKYSEIIERLGGTAVLDKEYDVLATHLVSPSLSRNEKCLASIACGLYVLKPAWLDACHAKGRFVQEGPFQHGIGEDLNSSSPMTRLSIAAMKWCELRNETEETADSFGAFMGWKVVMFVKKDQFGPFSRILEAGMAKILDASLGLDDVSHVFIDNSQRPDLDFKALLKRKVHCVTLEFLPYFLMNGYDDDPPTTSFIPLVVKAFIEASGSLEGRKRSSTDLEPESNRAAQFINKENSIAKRVRQ